MSRGHLRSRSGSRAFRQDDPPERQKTRTRKCPLDGQCLALRTRPRVHPVRARSRFLYMSRGGCLARFGQWTLPISITIFRRS